MVACALAANYGGTRTLLAGPAGRWLVVACHSDEQNLVKVDLATGLVEELKGEGLRRVCARRQAARHEGQAFNRDNRGSGRQWEGIRHVTPKRCPGINRKLHKSAGSVDVDVAGWRALHDAD